MWVTCYTDASWCAASGNGGWAYYLVSDKRRYAKSGHCPSWALCNNTAEMSAIVAGVYRAAREDDSVEGVSVYTDSQAAIDYLRYYGDGGSPNLRRDDWLLIRDKMYRILAKYECRVKFTHVKGHRYGRSKQIYMNNRVDQMAGAARLRRIHGNSNTQL